MCKRPYTYREIEREKACDKAVPPPFIHSYPTPVQDLPPHHSTLPLSRLARLYEQPSNYSTPCAMLLSSMDHVGYYAMSKENSFLEFDASPGGSGHDGYALPPDDMSVVSYISEETSPKNGTKSSLYKTELCKRFSEFGNCRYGGAMRSLVLYFLYRNKMLTLFWFPVVTSQPSVNLHTEWRNCVTSCAIPSTRRPSASRTGGPATVLTVAAVALSTRRRRATLSRRTVP